MISQNAAYLSEVVKTDRGFITLLNLEELITNLEEIDTLQEQIAQITG
ncbi:hypothetical protein [Bacillus sp. V5-8f]|nr:hypothetical protein [Bacillus sp. V5-8f]